MKQNKQQEAIAKLCGWQIIHDSKRPVGGRAHQIPPGKDIEWFMHRGEPAIDLPDYCNSLDDCRIFEATLTEKEKQEYVVNLCDIKGVKYQRPAQYTQDAMVACAFAEPIDRSRAFLETKGEREGST